jgi:hypothetical protein
MNYNKNKPSIAQLLADVLKVEAPMKYLKAQGGLAFPQQTMKAPDQPIAVPRGRSSQIKEHTSRADYTMPFKMRQRKDTTAEIAAQREQRIAASVKARAVPWTSTNWRERMAAETAATGDKLSLQQLPVVGKYIPNMLDATGGIGHMATALGSAPLRAKQENSLMPYVTAVGMPLALGAVGGLGVKTTGEFVNNMVNPLAGLPSVSKLFRRIKPPVVAAENRIVHGLYDDLGETDYSGHLAFYEENVDNTMIKPTTLLGKVKEYGKVKAQSVDSRIGAALDRSQKLTPLSDIVADANIRLNAGLGVNKTAHKVQLEHVDDNLIKVLINGHHTGDLEMASLAAKRKSLTELLKVKKTQKSLVNQFGHSSSMFENAEIQGYAKQGDFPFSEVETWTKDKLAAAFGPEVTTFRNTGISGEINKAISESLKNKNSRLYSGGTGHSVEGEIRYNNLLSKGFIEKITGRNSYGGDIYMYKKEGGKL